MSCKLKHSSIHQTRKREDGEAKSTQIFEHKNLIPNLFCVFIIIPNYYVNSSCIYWLIISNKSLSKYKNMIHDKTLPHTRDYVCKNKDCSSHKDPSKRDAVWFRPIATSYSTYYGCTACATIWNIS